MNIIAADHLSKLYAEAGDPGIMPMIALVEPVKLAWQQAYGHWTAVKGYRQGETKRFADMVAGLASNKIKEWDACIQAVHLEGSADYKALLPDKRKPFQSGGYEARINEVNALRERLAAYPALAALKTTVDAYYSELLHTRDVQKQQEGLVRQAVDRLELERVKLAIAMYCNLGALMAKYSHNTVEIERYFDLELIRRTGQGRDDEAEDPVSGIAAAGAVVNLLNGNFSHDTLVTLHNTGSTPLTAYLAAAPTDALATGLAGVRIAPGETISRRALEFGPAFYPCLNVRNESETVAGSWELEVA